MAHKSSLHIVGTGTIKLIGSSGRIKAYEKVSNLITTAGDLYYVTRAAAAVAPATPADATKMTGMKLGTSATTPTKSGAGAALVLYKTGSNVSFSGSYPTVTSIGADLGYRLTYYSTWGPGVATDTALSEAVIVNDSSVNATTTAANTIARITFTAINKQAGDTLSISWAHDFLGA